MKTISLKVPDELYEKMEKYRISENQNRSNYVMEAIVEYTKKIEREELKSKLKEELDRDRELNKGIIEEWDGTVTDGLEDEDW